MSDLNQNRRNLLIATSGAGVVAAAATAVPFVASLNPSARALAAGAPVEADVSQLDVGEMMTVEWRGKPVWIINRSQEMLDTLTKLDNAVADPKSEEKQQPEYCKNETRSIKPNILIAVGICTHLGCSPTSKFKHGNEDGMGEDWQGGFICPCHGSTFDFAGRVFKNKPAPTNLIVPPHTYLSDTRILIGEDRKEV